MRFRFSGHESFPCRYTWLPKAYRALYDNPLMFADEDHAMVKLGVGKNMVRAIKFWVQAFGIAKQQTGTPKFDLTTFSHSLFGENGLDPFLEDIKTLWLLHWRISTTLDEPLFAWYFLLNQWVDPTFSKSEAVKAFTLESERMERPLSSFTKEQHFDIFLHTYMPVKTRNGIEVLEDTLDCPLTELQLIRAAGERVMAQGRREPVYEFRQDSKIEITGALFSYCLFDFWKQSRSQESTLSFREISVVEGSIGQIFKLSELDLRSRLEGLQKDSNGLFEYLASAAVPRVIKHCDLIESTENILLNRIYGSMVDDRSFHETLNVYAD